MVPVPDGSGFVSCSADHSVKFWEWEILSAGAEGSAGQAPASRRLSARHARTLKMSDDVLCVRGQPRRPSHCGCATGLYHPGMSPWHSDVPLI